MYNKNKVLNQESLRNSVGSGVKDRDSVGNTNASITNNIKRINEVGNNIRFGFQDVVPPFNGERFCHKVSSGIRNESLDSNSLNNYNNVPSFNSTSVCSINCNFNSNSNMISALPVPPIVTANDDTTYKVSHRNIIKDKITLNTMTANTILTCSCSSLLSKKVSFVDSKPHHTARVHVITVPPKIWRPKMKDKFIPLPPHPDVDEDLYLSPSCGLAIRRTKPHPPKITNRDDLLLWNECLHAPQPTKHLHLSNDIDAEVQDTILQVIKDN